MKNRTLYNLYPAGFWTCIYCGWLVKWPLRMAKDKKETERVLHYISAHVKDHQHG